MAEYTYNNVIINPTSEKAKSYIGKKVYYANTPMECLERANRDNTHFLARLNNINDKFPKPFIIDKADFISSESNVVCIIPKKEEPKPKYVPFENADEFIDAFHYHDNDKYSETDDILLNYGMWLRFNNDDVICAVTEIWTDGVFIGHDHMKIKWEELFNFYNFLDGTSCGKEVEE